MERREFIKLLTSSFAASILPLDALAQSPQTRQPLSQLVHAQTGAPYNADTCQYKLALFMTAGALYPSCGEAVISVVQNKEELQKKGYDIESVMVVPNPSLQANPSDTRNASSAHAFKLPVLTGPWQAIRSAAQDYQVPYHTSANGKISDHSLYAALIAPDGQYLMAYHTSTFFMEVVPQLERAIQHYQSRHPEVCGPGPAIS